jgi:integrase
MARKRSKKRGNGEGTIYQRTDGTWSGQITVATDPITGKVTRKTFYGATQGEVVAKMKDFRATHPTAAAGSKMRLKEACDFWLAGHKTRIAASTVDRYETDLRFVTQHLGPAQIGSLSALDVQNWISTLAAAGVSPQQQKMSLTRLRSVLKKCLKMGLVATNVAQVADGPQVRRAPVVPLTKEQIATLLREAEGEPLEALYWLALDSGARQGELFALAWPDVDLDAGEVYIRQNLQRTKHRLTLQPPKTPKSRRRIVLAPQTVAKLRAHRESACVRPLTIGRTLTPPRSEGGLVFANTKGGYLNASDFWKRQWLPLLLRAGLARQEGHGWPRPVIRFHDLRHTMATLLLIAGVHPKVVAEQLGHSSIRQTLDTYSHVIPTMQQTAAQAMAGILPSLS